ncbi:unnamed protein product [Arctia plantaginis]|uniref:Uncharacterized protein n=1 Tax=Arctia plantaginis TaxID=874455 RepID=A0A8S1B416_ARCPL|nr:unnamed protein product [Arctia plantaginis]CAB3259182.1 unnamed protein product [Arctia plantaginis]
MWSSLSKKSSRNFNSFNILGLPKMRVLSSSRRPAHSHVTQKQTSWSFNSHSAKKICKWNTDIARLNHKVALTMRGDAR